jgi:hypothetical protein
MYIESVLGPDPETHVVELLAHPLIGPVNEAAHRGEPTNMTAHIAIGATMRQASCGPRAVRNLPFFDRDMVVSSNFLADMSTHAISASH